MERARRAVLLALFLSALVGAGFYLVGGPGSFSGPFEPPYGDETLRLSEEVYERTDEANDLLVDTWLQHQLFSWKWWMNVLMAVIPWLVWVWVRPRESTHRLLHVGLVLMLLSSYQDFIGVMFGLWRYHVEVFPTIPSYLPWDFCMYPVAGMLLFQFEPRLSRYLKALLFATAATLAIEPLFVTVQFYEPVRWSVFYSFPIHFVNYLIGHWFGTRTAFKPLGPEEAAPKWTPPDLHSPRPE